MVLTLAAGAMMLGLTLLAWRARRNDALIPVVAPARETAREGLPLVSVIVPARNEAKNLRALLPTLQAQTYAQVEVTVVDDDSRDATARVAMEHGVRVIELADLPAGWTGKARACHVGALDARGDWLLFVDADVRLNASAVAAAVAQAEHQGVQVLSVLLGQECDTFFEKMMLPYAYAQYMAGAPVREHMNPRDPRAILNGQFILFRRSTYMETGGMALVRGAVMEDLALGGALKARGIAVGLARGDGLGRVRMYGSAGDLWRGFAKTAISSLEHDPRGGVWIVLAQWLASLTVPLVLLSAGSRNAPALGLAAVAFGVATMHVGRWCRRYDVSWAYGLLHAPAADVMMAIALGSLIRRWRGKGVEWKQRTIPARPTR